MPWTPPWTTFVTAGQSDTGILLRLFVRQGFDKTLSRLPMR